ncbi:MAG: MerC domain-containing protein [Erythrobacter sp.]|uniref:MerC domain-containing protein n=1 Tax=Erythrobacter sp. TaxID=1042 RepID=UPI001B118453|nr:MerC domain-containing protein [Erythrobacter sp.]MBO6767252.1 MerC domain-containing protein [Erythrobacter sp.]
MLQRAISPIRRRLDRVGIFLSGACAVHCLLSIVLVSGLGIGGELFLSPEIHRFGLVLATLIAAVAIGWGALRHRMATPFVIAMTGLTFMGGALAVPHGYKEAVLTIIGVALVSLGHILNLRHVHSAACKERCGD